MECIKSLVVDAGSSKLLKLAAPSFNLSSSDLPRRTWSTKCHWHFDWPRAPSLESATQLIAHASFKSALSSCNSVAVSAGLLDFSWSRWVVVAVNLRSAFSAPWTILSWVPSAVTLLANSHEIFILGATGSRPSQWPTRKELNDCFRPKTSQHQSRGDDHDHWFEFGF